MISLAIQTVFVRGRRCAVRTQRRPEDLRIVSAFLSARAAATTAPAVDRLGGPEEVARFELSLEGVRETGVDSNPVPTSVP